MRFSRHILFLVAAAIASAVNGAPVGEKLERRQQIMLELTPTQKVDVDGSGEVPTIVITDQGLQFTPPGCVGNDCQAFAMNRPEQQAYEDLVLPQTSFDPYAENYAGPSAFYRPTTTIPIAGQGALPMPSARVGPAVQVLRTEAMNAPIAGWNAPLIPSGNFQPALHGLVPTPSMPVLPDGTAGTNTMTAPAPVPGAVPLTATAQAGAPSLDPVLAMNSPAAPLPGPGASAPGTPTLTASPPLATPAAMADISRDEKLASQAAGVDKVEAEPAPPSSPSPPADPAPIAPNPSDNQKVAEQAKEDAKEEEKPDVKGVPSQKERRGMRSGMGKRSADKRDGTSQRLTKRHLEVLDTQADCPASRIETKETLIPVTVDELAQLQEGLAELVAYPSVDDNGLERDTVYDVVPSLQDPEPIDLTMKSLLSLGAAHMSGQDDDDFVAYRKRSDGEGLNGRQAVTLSGSQGQMRIDGSADASELHKRLKHDSNGFNASLVKNGIGKKKYGYSIHNNNGASSVASGGVVGTMFIAALLGVWTTVL